MFKINKFFLTVFFLYICIFSVFAEREVLQEPSWGNWFADVETDPITDSKFILLGNRSLKSTNEDLFMSNATIIIASAYKKNFISIDWGLVIGEDSKKMPVLIRIDSQEPYQDEWVVSEGGNRIEFPNQFSDFCLKIMDADRMAIRCLSEQQYTAVFDVNGLRDILTYYADDMFGDS